MLCFSRDARCNPNSDTLVSKHDPTLNGFHGPRGSSSVKAIRRKGAAVVETAILLPVFVLTVLAAIECANALYLKQSLTLAAYESATILEEQTGTLAEAETRCSQILNARDVQTFELTVSPNPESVDSGGVITVDVSADASAYSVGPSFFFQNSTMGATVSIVRR